VSLSLKKANWITLALCVGVIQFSVYYFLSATVRTDRLLAVAQPDTSLYFQATRRIVEGGAFTFSAGGPVHTGTTSVLYPFILAIPYLMGFKENLLPLAGFVLNATFYLLFLFNWLRIVDHTIKDNRSKAVSALALALFGQLAFVSFAQSDTGFWLAVSSFFALGLAKDKPALWGGMLLVAPWVRPEGVICAMSALFVALATRRHRKIALLGLLSVVGMFLLNRFLTGTFQFTSLQGKGHFANEPFFLAVLTSFQDAMRMFRQLFLGLSSGTMRETYFFPVLGAFFMWWHVFHRDYSDFSSREALFLLAAAGGFATVATSGMQGTNMDRYLAWIMPIAIIWTACGAVACGARLKGAARALPVVLVLAFGLVGSILGACRFRGDCERVETKRAFAEQCERVLPGHASLGGFGNANLVYWLTPRRFEHLYGIYSPAFKTKHLVSAFETLKHEPRRRFDFWIYDAQLEGMLVEEAARAVFGEAALIGPMGLELRKADWAAFDTALQSPALGPEAGACVCKARVDVGYEADERQADYRVHGAFSLRPPDPFFRLDTSDKRPIAEVGRVITGGDEMTLSGLETGKDVHVVMRTARKAKAETLAPDGVKTDDYHFGSAQALEVFVDDAPAGVVRYDVSERGFTEAVFTIPGRAITRSSCRIALRGGHIAFCYWFYQ